MADIFHTALTWAVWNYNINAIRLGVLTFWALGNLEEIGRPGHKLIYMDVLLDYRRIVEVNVNM